MTNNRQMFRNNTLLFVFLLGWNFLPAQSSTLNSLSDELGNFQKHYVYPSILRALIGKEDESFNLLIKDIEYLRILKIDSAFISKHSSICSTTTSDLEKEGFESVALMQEKGSVSEFYILEKDEQIDGFILYRKDPSSYLIIEIVGDIHIAKLNDLMNIDYENFNFLIE